MKKIKNIQLALLIAGVIALAGCGKDDGVSEAEIESEEAAAGQDDIAQAGIGEKETGFAGESARDAEIDFESLKEKNPDIFGWLYIPGTGIDYPVLQSEEADDYYEAHDAYGEQNKEGALYTELANLKNMCDFNTVIHGKTLDDDGGLFSDLHLFSDPDFFASHEQAYLYLEGNVLTYEIFMACERENTSLIRTYDFTYGSGCEKFLEDLYGSREMGKNQREGWEGVTPYHFLITLTTEAANQDKQFIVVAALVEDAAGEINRTVEW
ncbi:MAG: class B sortase [Clostridium sp.]|nr:class B sortase [Clostridium sp.]